MKQQLLAKVLASLLLGGSLSVTACLSYTYVGAVLGLEQGAGAAQWQFAFMLVPLPVALAIVALGIARLSKPPLARLFSLTAGLAAAVPLALLALVRLHVY